MPMSATEQEPLRMRSQEVLRATDEFLRENEIFSAYPLDYPLGIAGNQGGMRCKKATVVDLCYLLEDKLWMRL